MRVNLNRRFDEGAGEVTQRPRTSVRYAARARRVVAVLLIASWTSGCAFLNGAYDTVRVDTNVPAGIYREDQLVGRTTDAKPVVIRLRRGTSTCSRPGPRATSRSR